VIHHPRVRTFLRTSYVSAPRAWTSFSTEELVGRIEQLLTAHYRVRAASLQGSDDLAQVIPFSFDFEWVAREEMPAQPDFESLPWMLPCAAAHPHLFAIADREMDATRRVARPGIDARGYRDAFAVFRIDEDDTWHLVRHYKRAAMFVARYDRRHERPRAAALSSTC
jgi:hypothetical protein